MYPSMPAGADPLTAPADRAARLGGGELRGLPRPDQAAFPFPGVGLLRSHLAVPWRGSPAGADEQAPRVASRRAPDDVDAVRVERRAPGAGGRGRDGDPLEQAAEHILAGRDPSASHRAAMSAPGASRSRSAAGRLAVLAAWSAVAIRPASPAAISAKSARVIFSAMASAWYAASTPRSRAASARAAVTAWSSAAASFGTRPSGSAGRSPGR